MGLRHVVVLDIDAKVVGMVTRSNMKEHHLVHYWRTQGAKFSQEAAVENLPPFVVVENEEQETREAEIELTKLPLPSAETSSEQMRMMATTTMKAEGNATNVEAESEVDQGEGEAIGSSHDPTAILTPTIDQTTTTSKTQKKVGKNGKKGSSAGRGRVLRKKRKVPLKLRRSLYTHVSQEPASDDLA